MQLKNKNLSIGDFEGSSQEIHVTNAPRSSLPRDHYLAHLSETRPPIISSSEFIPEQLVSHLMQHKKDSAIGVKFINNRKPPDQITNMEGMMHTFITPVMIASMHGDYYFDTSGGYHRVRSFSTADAKQRGRTVVISASVQPDFEDSQVLLELCALNESAIEGDVLDNKEWKVADDRTRANDKLRRAYDVCLKQHVIYHLTKDRRLPGLGELMHPNNTPVDVSKAIETLEQMILASKCSKVESPVNHKSVAELYVRLENRLGSVISTELLYNIAREQLHNELSVLEHYCPQGYVYTNDPPAIFAAQIKSRGVPNATLLNRISFLALKHLLDDGIELLNMKAYAFNDYADDTAIHYLSNGVFSRQDVKVLAKAKLFDEHGFYCTKQSGATGALLVLHNNSDGFGQNIETESAKSSMDGAIGAWSSAAGSLHRNREDLLFQQLRN